MITRQRTTDCLPFVYLAVFLANEGARWNGRIPLVLLCGKSGAEGQNRTADTTIFRRSDDAQSDDGKRVKDLQIYIRREDVCEADRWEGVSREGEGLH